MSKVMRVSKIESVSKIENKVSVCDIMKNNTSEIIKKIESKTPSLMQKYSDLYMQYLHTIDDIFGTCYISEKEFFDKLNLDQNVLKEVEKFSNSLTAISLNQIEASSKYLEAYMQMRVSALKTYDDFMHVMMDSYAKTLSQLNKSTDS
jgi:virulence-associated protein VapD